MKNNRPHLLVVDGSNLLFQMFYGMPARIIGKAGKPIHGTLGFVGALFFVIDQIDSLLGVFLILCLFSDIGVSGYFIYLAVGAVSHILINVVLRFFKLRKTL